jgi:hypothetical protein
MNTSRRRFLLALGGAIVSTGIGLEKSWSDRAQAAPHPSSPTSASHSEISRKHIMIEEMTKDTFEPHLNTIFHVQDDTNQRVDLKLVEVSDHQTDAQTEQFSLIFKGTRNLLLPQQIYTFEHADLGEFALFIVPILSADQTQYTYQAVFNRLRSPA